MRNVGDVVEVESTETEILLFKPGASRPTFRIPRKLWAQIKNAAVYVPPEELK